MTAAMLDQAELERIEEQVTRTDDGWQKPWDRLSVALRAKAHAIESFPNEAVGAVIEGAYRPLVNVAADPQRCFEVESLPIGTEALIHSHTLDPSQAPSAHDMASQQATGLPWGILACNGVSCSEIEWFGDDGPVAPYLGRKFLSGVRDCWCLIRDIYRQEQGIVLPNLPRDENWFEREIDLLSPANIAAAGFRQISFEEVRPGDLCLGMLASRIVNHCGLYVGRGLILHHMRDRLSCREPVKPWERTIRYFLRHEAMFKPDAEWMLKL